MKKLLLLFFLVLFYGQITAQSDAYWYLFNGTESKGIANKMVERETFPKEFKLYSLNPENFYKKLYSSIENKNESTIISIPNTEGNIEQFELFEASNFDPALQARFPQIRAFSGKGISDKSATIKLSVSPQGIQTMVFRTDRENEFMEPYSQDRKVYAVYKSSRSKGTIAFTCSTEENKVYNNIESKINTQRSSAGQLKVLRLAQSCTGEYAAYYGASTAGTPADLAIVLAAFNATLTRCNGVYEKDLGIHLNLVNDTDVIYFNPASDPYGATDANYNAELAITLFNNVGDANFDIGHLFSAIGNNGNAGCIGCICSNDRTTDINGDGVLPDLYKGSGFTTSTAPVGDNFDIDFVVHEVGHQLGANHTFSFVNEETGVNMEPGSGVTIMGYAGITPQDVAPHSIDEFHAASINQIQVNMAPLACPVTTNISANNATPIAIAGADFTIPLSTPFMLTGSATDANTADVLTYMWEQFNNASLAQTGANSAAAVAKATGPNWRSYDATISPIRYFPVMSSILGGQVTTAGSDITVEALSSVARTLNFRLTVRDNAPYSSSAPVKVGQTNFDDMVVTVANKTALTVTMAANTSYPKGSTQTVVWTGATGANGHSTIAGGANVDIAFSADNGVTWTTLVTATPNDGSQAVTLPAGVAAPYCRFRVKANANIFFNISPVFAVGYTITTTCNNYTINPNAAIPDNNTAFTVHAINVPTSANISDVNLAANVTHTWVSDVEIVLQGPMATTTQSSIFNRGCDNTGATDNINATFDDQGAAAVCNTTITGNVIPASPLSVFNGLNPNGDWLVGIRDLATQDTGTINSYTLTICSQQATLSTESFELDNFSLSPNPNNGNFNIQFTSNLSNDVKINVHDIRGRQVFEKSFANNGTFNQNINLNNVEAGVYLVTISDGAKKTVKKIVIE